nr:MAG TPA: hypothetical protein [Caudoviricetes sp.]
MATGAFWCYAEETPTHFIFNQLYWCKGTHFFCSCKKVL